MRGVGRIKQSMLLEKTYLLEVFGEVISRKRMIQSTGEYHMTYK